MTVRIALAALGTLLCAPLHAEEQEPAQMQTQAQTPTAAPSLFTAVSPSADLSPKQEEQIRRLRNLPSTEALTLIRVDSGQLQSKRAVQVTLAPGKLYDLANSRYTRASDRAYAWSGVTDKTLAGMGDLPEGEATFAVNGNAVSGSIRTADGVYKVQPLPGGIHALVKVRESALPPEHPPSGASNAPAPATAPNDAAADQAVDASAKPQPVIVLIVFTKSAATYDDPLAFSRLLVEQANQSYEASGISTLRLQLAGAQVTHLADSGSDAADLAALVAGKTGETRKVHRNRDKLKADLVVMIADNPAACGLAQAIYASADTAYATVYHDCAASNLSFAHEIGHLLGACHDPAQGKPCSPFAYGHGFQRTSAGMRTIMAYQCSGTPCQRMSEWSRPPVWGNADLSNDARVLAQTAQRASKFR